MTQKLRKCGGCRLRAVAPAVVDYITSFPINGVDVEVAIPEVPLFQCSHCGTRTLGYDALVKIDDTYKVLVNKTHPAPSPHPQPTALSYRMRTRFAEDDTRERREAHCQDT